MYVYKANEIGEAKNNATFFLSRPVSEKRILESWEKFREKGKKLCFNSYTPPLSPILHYSHLAHMIQGVFLLLTLNVW